jgi:DNA-binding SARP family transcriptional activator/ABC-type transport system substrate-binding protein
MEFRLLGPVDAVRGDHSLPLGGPKPRALLAVLLLHANEVVSRDRLIEGLWPDREPGSADHSLDVQISRLRKALEPDDVLLTRGGGYVLQVDPHAIDASRFEGLLESGRRANAAGRPQKALDDLEAALGLWRGEPLGDLAYEDFARSEVERLDELRRVAIEEQIDAELTLGRHDTLVPKLEALTAKHPLRERLRGQSMLALYRSGRQAEALRVYADTRRRLVDELGIEPSPQLRELEQAILRQDPSLDLPGRAKAARKRGALVGAGALVAAGAAVAVIVGLTKGGTEGAQALADADSNVLLSVNTGEVVREAPVRDTVRVAYGHGALWSVSSTGELTRLEPGTGEEVATLGLGIEPAGLAVGEGSVWVTGSNSPVLLRIDPTVNEVVDRFQLPMDGVITNETGEVAVGAGSVWVGHGAFNPGAWVERLDPKTGRVQKRFSILAGDVDHLSFAEGALWVGSTPSGELRKIEPRTNEVVLRRQLQSQLCCVAAGGGYVWAASNPDGVVWKVTSNGRLLPTIELPSAVASLTFADGALWAALGERGTLVRIDPTTNAIREYALGHSVTSVDVRDGVIATGVRQSVADLTRDLKGDVVWVGRKASTLFDSGAATDPAFTAPTWDAPQLQFHYATCARLLNYADAEGEAGKRLVPEVAEAMPVVSDGGRTYTFRIRKGFGFSPPSNEEVTAESFQHAIERVLSPKFDYVVPQALNIVGVEEYRAGTTAHISGVSAEDGRLVIRLRRPAPDLPWIAALSCAVPLETPVVPDGVKTPVASAGPYYLAEHADSYAILRRNPNYGGIRPQHLDAIVFKFSVAPGRAASQTEEGRLDYFLESDNPMLTPSTAAARGAGARYNVTPASGAGVTFLGFNYERPLFSSVRMRRAVQYALDRVALADASADGVVIPATRLLSPRLPGYDATPLYPPRGDLRRARALAGGRKARAVVYTWDDPPYTDAFNRALREQLAAIGIKTTVLRMDQAKGFEREKANRADLSWGGLPANTPDLGAYLQPLSWLPPEYSDEIRRISTLSSPERERAALSLARRIDRDSLFAVYATRAMPELVSRRLGCIVHHPVYAGVDLAALCLRDGNG